MKIPKIELMFIRLTILKVPLLAFPQLRYVCCLVLKKCEIKCNFIFRLVAPYNACGVFWSGVLLLLLEMRPPTQTAKALRGTHGTTPEIKMYSKSAHLIRFQMEIIKV